MHANLILTFNLQVWFCFPVSMIKQDAHWPHVEPICLSISTVFLPLSLTFNTYSRWFKCDTPYHQSKYFYLLNMQIRLKIVKFLTSFDPWPQTVALTFDIETYVFTCLLVKVNISTKYYDNTTITCEVMAKTRYKLQSFDLWPDLDLFT